MPAVRTRASSEGAGVSAFDGDAEVRELPSSARRARERAPLVLGYVELVSLPSWGVAGIAAKVDTGAETSALHVRDLRLRGATRVCFSVFDGDEARDPVPVEARLVRRGLVRSSNGHTEERLFVRTSVTLGGRSHSVEIGLVDRSQMEFRMLIGRSALESGYLVDPSRRFLAGR